MHISLDVLLEELAKHPGTVAEPRSSVRHLGISGITTEPAQAKESTLLITSAEDAGELDTMPKHMLVILRDDTKEPEVEAPELAFIHTDQTVEEVYAEACSAMLALSNWDSRMLEAIAARQDVSAVLAIAAERLDNPIALFDSKGALVSYAGSLNETAEHTIWREVLLNRYSPIEYYTRDEQASFARNVRKPWPFVFTPQRDLDHCYLMRGIFVDGKPIGSIGMVDVNAPITSGQVALAELVSDRLRLALSIRLGSGPGEDDTAYLLRSILNGNKADRGLVSYHVDKLGWGQHPTFWLLACETPEGEGDQIASATRMERISRLLRNALCIDYERRTVALVANHDPALNGELTDLLQKLGVHAVSSASFSTMSGARQAYEQCDLGLRVAANDEPVRTLTPYPELFERVLVNAFDPALDPQVICDQTILALSEGGFNGDVERGKALVRELHAYLMNGCNALLTARQLYMHRNTLLYHISQVEGLLETSLADLSTSRKLALIVSCLVAMWR